MYLPRHGPDSRRCPTFGSGKRLGRAGNRRDGSPCCCSCGSACCSCYGRRNVTSLPLRVNARVDTLAVKALQPAAEQPPNFASRLDKIVILIETDIPQFHRQTEIVLETHEPRVRLPQLLTLSVVPQRGFADQLIKVKERVIDAFGKKKPLRFWKFFRALNYPFQQVKRFDKNRRFVHKKIFLGPEGDKPPSGLPPETRKQQFSIQKGDTGTRREQTRRKRQSRSQWFCPSYL